jgi:predicted enzyme related to lactoylglutathione lyase
MPSFLPSPFSSKTHLDLATDLSLASAGAKRTEGEITMIGVTAVQIEVEDQDRAKEFWTEKMGFEIFQDEPYKDDWRWVELRTPDKAVILGLSRREGERPVPADEMLPTSNVWFYTDDLPQAYEDLTARGVKFPVAPAEMPWGWWSIFEDTEGNRFVLVPPK